MLFSCIQISTHERLYTHMRSHRHNLKSRKPQTMVWLYLWLIEHCNKCPHWLQQYKCLHTMIFGHNEILQIYSYIYRFYNNINNNNKKVNFISPVLSEGTQLDGTQIHRLKKKKTHASFFMVGKFPTNLEFLWTRRLNYSSGINV